MLQQTKVSRVLERYPRWLERFPNFATLASASPAEVLAEWQGMGYNRRALWLQRIAQTITVDFNGKLPEIPEELVKLPGIGANTAGSITAFAYDKPVVFIETNIRRVFIYHFFADANGIDDKQLMPLIAAAVDAEHPREWYYALMDYGSHLAKSVPNPNQRSKHYTVQSKLAGSRRELRGEVLRRLLEGPRTEAELRAEQGKVSLDDARLSDVLTALMTEGFITERDGCYLL
jgi:A/G-specific adenine glycosylase